MRAAIPRILLLTSLASVTGGLAGAWAEVQVYRWVDDDGTLIFSSGLDRVPERHRGSAELMPVSPSEMVVPPVATPEPAASPAAISEAVASPAASPEVVPSPTANVSRVNFIPGAPILVHAWIGGAGPVTLLLDTGADRTLIAPAALRALRVLAQPAGRAQIKGVAGSTVADVVWVSSLEVGQARAGPLPIVAHDAGVERAHGLLGRDFLDRFRVTIDSQNGVVILAPLR
jgi:Aspartyl protease